MSKKKLGIPAETLKKLNEHKASYPSLPIPWISQAEEQLLLNKKLWESQRTLSGEMIFDQIKAEQMMAAFKDPQLAKIGRISADDLTTRLADFKDRCFKEVKPKEEKTENPFEVTEKELGLFGLSKMDILLRAIADPTLEVEVTIRRKKDALTISKSIELHDAETDNLVLVDLSSIVACKHIDAYEEERWDHHYANAVITFTDDHKEYFRESTIQINKKIKEASL
jgi:hypothetical protein